LSLLSSIVTDWTGEVRANVFFSAVGPPFFLLGHFILCCAKGLSQLSLVDGTYMTGITFLAVFLAGPTHIFGWTPPVEMLIFAGGFLATSFALIVKKRVLLMIPSLAFLASVLLFYVGVSPHLTNLQIVPVGWKVHVPIVTMCASSLYLASNSLLLLYMPPSITNIAGQGSKVLASTLLFSGNAIGLQWHSDRNESPELWVTHLRGFISVVIVLYISVQEAMGRSVFSEPDETSTKAKKE